MTSKLLGSSVQQKKTPASAVSAPMVTEGSRDTAIDVTSKIVTRDVSQEQELNKGSDKAAAMPGDAAVASVASPKRLMPQVLPCRTMDRMTRLCGIPTGGCRPKSWRCGSSCG